MPAPIDQDQRRRRIAKAATDLITRFGLDGLTMRQVADSAGLSSGAVTHYFASKRDLLLFTYQWVSDQSRNKVEKALEKDPTDLPGLLEALCYVDEPNYWKVYFAFWQIALYDDDFLAEQRFRTDSVRKMLVDMFKRRAAAGYPVPEDIARAARDLVLIVQGLGLQSILHENYWTLKSKRQFLRDQIRRVTLPDGVEA